MLPLARRFFGVRRLAAVTAAVALASTALLITAPPAAAATVDPTAWYVLLNRTSGKAVDVAGSSSTDGAQIQQWARHDGLNQQFQFVDAGGGDYRIKARHSGKVLSVLNSSAADGAQIVQWADSNGANQRFRLVDTDSGYVKLVNRGSGKVLDVNGASTADGARVIQWSDHNGGNQQWQLVPVGTGPGDGALPSSFRWNSSGALVGPKNDGRNIRGIKDPTVVYQNGRYHVFASTAKAEGYNLVYFNFTDWSQANNATFHYLDQTPVGAGYRAAPEVFYFAPQGLWYLVYQTGNASYSTNPDISNPAGWTAPRHFYSSMPQIIRDNIGNGYWVDMWVVCDAANCYLFSSDDNGHLYRSQTTVGQFPNGMTNTVIAMSDPNPYALFEASNVYKVQGQNQYVLIIEAIGSQGRYFRSWTSNALNGSWTPLAASESNPFAGAANVSFPGGSWTRDISHGEVVRTVVDQTLTISPCQIRYLYQGRDPNSGGDYNSLPWRLGLLTQTNSTC